MFGLLLVSPITTKPKNYLAEIPLPESSPVSGVVLAQHVRTIDWRGRAVRIVGRADPEVLADVRSIVAAIIER